MHTKTIKELSLGLSKGDFSSKELVEVFIQRIKNLDTKLNSFITITEEEAYKSASKADILYQNGKASPLTGIPIAHKDIFCTANIKTSCASKMLDNFIAPYDATVVDKLKKAGTVILGKTNMDEFAMGSSNETSFYGPAYNPWNLECVPGGSSGGSAAAVAARLVPAATGTDTGGSIRQPAALCGISGLKPTYGLVSRYGMVAFASSLDQGGLMAQTAEDCALLLQEIAGFDDKDSTSINHSLPDYSNELTSSIRNLRIGIPEEFLDKRLNPQVGQLIEESIKKFTELGAKVETISLPNSSLSIPTYYVICSAECSSNLARYDGVRYGHRCEDPKDLNDLYIRSRDEGFGDEVKRRILIGTYVLSSGYYDAYYIKAQKVRRLIKQDFVEAFKKVDLILGPTTPEPSFRIGEKSNDPVSMYLNDIYTAGANLAGLPAISFPIGFVNNLPIGGQLIGNFFKEDQILNAAHQYQQVTDWHKKIPNLIN